MEKAICVTYDDDDKEIDFLEKLNGELAKGYTVKMIAPLVMTKTYVSKAIVILEKK